MTGVHVLMRKITLAGAVGAFALVAACGDNFLTGGELSTDPNRPTQATSAQLFVGIENQNPALGRGFERLIARPSEIVAPGTFQHEGAVRFRNLDGSIGRSGVDDDDLVDDVLGALQALGQEALLVLDDHAQA